MKSLAHRPPSVCWCRNHLIPFTWPPSDLTLARALLISIVPQSPALGLAVSRSPHSKHQSVLGPPSPSGSLPASHRCSKIALPAEGPLPPAGPTMALSRWGHVAHQPVPAPESKAYSLNFKKASSEAMWGKKAFCFKISWHCIDLKTGQSASIKPGCNWN